MSLQPITVEDIQTIIRAGNRIKPSGGSTKPALSAPEAGVEILDMRTIHGILEYQPEEYTFTALAGTPLRDVQAALAEKGQYMPFDPPLVDSGATLGGTAATGLSGPGRFHHGGIRDCLLGVRFVDGLGRLISGGGKVVKNAAGFDLPKLMVGSLGAYGVMFELTFKALPQPTGFITLVIHYEKLTEAIEKIRLVSKAHLDLEALDLIPTEDGFDLWIRFGGLENTLAPRLERLVAAAGSGVVYRDAQESALWKEAVELTWAPRTAPFAKIAVTPSKILTLDPLLEKFGCQRRYSVGGQIAWVSCEDLSKRLEEPLQSLHLNGLMLWGGAERVHIGKRRGLLFAQRIKSVFDPKGLFVEA